MPIIQHAILTPDGFDPSRLKTAVPGDISIAISFRLPFRLRFDKLVYFTCDLKGRNDVWFRNEVPIRPGTDIAEISKLCWHHHDHWPIRTDAVVILHDPVVSDDLLKAIHGDSEHIAHDDSNVRTAIEIINRCLIAYSAGTDLLLVEGQIVPPLGWIDLFECLLSYIALVGYKEQQLADSTILELFAIRADRRMTRVGNWGSCSSMMEDLPNLDTIRIQDLLSSHDSNLHHELAVMAKSLMVKSQPAMALLIAIAALETVHGAFIRQVLGATLPDDEGSTDGLINDFMRDQGFYALIRISPYLFLEPSERPTREDVKKCTKGIEMRNAIMHGLARKGRYKMRGYSFEDYTHGYTGAVALYKVFSTALERRLQVSRPASELSHGAENT
jgi:hypothetical protein